MLGLVFFCLVEKAGCTLVKARSSNGKRVCSLRKDCQESRRRKERAMRQGREKEGKGRRARAARRQKRLSAPVPFGAERAFEEESVSDSGDPVAVVRHVVEWEADAILHTTAGRGRSHAGKALKVKTVLSK